jgi:hypothetical protein
MGIEVIEHHRILIPKIVERVGRQLEADSDAIAPLVLLGECSKRDASVKKVFSKMDELVLRRKQNPSIEFHRRLCRFLRGLVGFFGDAKGKVVELLAAQSRLSEQETQAHCFFTMGLLKGLGVRAVLELRVIERLEETIASSKKRDMKDIEANKRFCCIYTVEALWLTFGRMMEPYLTRLLDILLAFLGDHVEAIRSAARRVLDRTMREVSEFGIKNLIPSLMRGAQDKNWRTKLSCIHALGAVSYCGTKQLSTSLPVIVPQLTATINDTNEEVRNAAVASLSLILSTIRNPEISDNRDVLIKSLSDPFHHNTRSLDLLLQTRFMHYIDGPALSLVMPVILYGLKISKDDQSKEKASKVVANISALVARDEDILPHIEALLEALMIPLKEMEPEVRAVTAKAFKSLAIKFKRLARPMINLLKGVLENENVTPIERVS